MPKPPTRSRSSRSSRGLGNRAIKAMVIFATLLASVAMPGSRPSSTLALALGKGNYAITSSVFGTDLDGLIGEETSNGRKIRPFDRLVALPACTESSCPWLEVGADPDGDYGPQTACAESDGLCWVQIISTETGQCTVAPVLDRGPLFVKDNWWNLRKNRTYYLKRGLPAAEVAADGGDLGYGAGMSDVGLDVAGDYPYAAAIDLGAGTFVDLGLDPDQGIADVRVRLLWQAGVNHLDSCGASYGNAITVDSVNLRTGPSTDDDVLRVLPNARRLAITGAMQNGFYLVDVDGDRGWVFSDYVQPDGGEVGADIGFITDEVNFRAGPSTSDDVYQVVPEGSVVVISGSEQNGFLPVTFGDQDGWISSAYIDLGNETGGGGGDGDTGSGDIAITTDWVNFRAGPSLIAGVISVLEPGTTVELNGGEEDGFVSVTFNDYEGWVFADYLLAVDGAETMRVTERLNLRAGPSTADEVLLIMPEGATVIVTGESENGFLPVTYNGTDGWAFAQYLE